MKSRFLNGVAEIVMTEDEIGDVGNRGVNQRITFLLKVVID